MAEFEPTARTEGFPKLDANSRVTDRMVEAALKAWLTSPDFSTGTYNAMRAAIEAALKEQPAPEPVAWRWKAVIDGDRISNWVLTHSEPPPYAVAHEPLYLHPPQRQPLTEDQIAAISIDLAASHQYTDVAFARAIERAHGIEGNT